MPLTEHERERFPSPGEVSPAQSLYKFSEFSGNSDCEGNDFPIFSKTDIALFTTFAGIGHNRVCEDTKAAFCEDDSTEALRWKIEIFKSLAGKAHGPGSNNKIAKAWTEFTQRHSIAQWLVAGILHELVVRYDSEAVLKSAEDFLSSSKKSDVVFVVYHPDLAYLLSYYKERLKKKFDKNIRVIVVMTDHITTRPQFVWYPVQADALFVPDAGSAHVAEKQLRFWAGPKGNVPDIETVNYPIHPSLTQNLSQEQLDYKRAQAEGEKTNLQIFIPLGGSAPQQEYLLLFKQSLLSSYDTHVLIKSSGKTSDFEAKMKSMKANVHTAATSQEVLARFIQIFQDVVPSIMVTKPSELHALLLVPPNLQGGSIVLFTPPVGDQEVQNIEWARSEGLIPAKSEQQKMYKANISQLDKYREMATKWRGMQLPEDPVDAAIFVTKLKAAGILASMVNYDRIHESGSTISWSGAWDSWRAIHDFLAESEIKKQP